jgi:hypothetical protein
MSEEKVLIIEEYAAIQKMQKERGWELLMARYGKEGDELLTKILDIQTEDRLRTLYVFQLKSLGTLAKVLEDIKIEAELEIKKKDEPQHIGT